MDQKELFSKIITDTIELTGNTNKTLAAALTQSTNNDVVFTINDDGSWSAEGEIEPADKPASNEIWYMTDDGEPYNMAGLYNYLKSSSGFTINNKILSNKISKSGDYYILKFENNVTQMGFPNSEVSRVLHPVFLGSTCDFIDPDIITNDIISVMLPDKLNNLGESSFDTCEKLESITIPSGVTSIEDFVFYYCSGLTNITIPSGVTNIGSSAFESCTSLAGITIPSRVTSIRYYAFNGCTSLNRIAFLGTTPAELGEDVFNNTPCLIYVPEGCVDAYKTAWAEYADRIRKIEPAPEIEMVDLGLPSGTLWAKYNIGVDPNDLDTAEKWYGNYYAWGEIETKTDYSGTPEGAYKWGTIDEESRIINLTKYNTKSEYGTVDNKTVLEPEDDVATVIYGSGFRMPTCGYNPDTEEITGDYGELINPEYTTIDYYFEKPEDYEGDIVYKGNYNSVPGLYGILIKSKINGNSIFIPSAGVMLGSTLYSNSKAGTIWSVSLFDNTTTAYAFTFERNGDRYPVDDGYRYYGRSIRAIQKVNSID